MAETIIGSVYKCKYNDIKGVAVAYAVYLGGRIRVALLKRDSDEYLWFDYDLLQEVK